MSWTERTKPSTTWNERTNTGLMWFEADDTWDEYTFTWSSIVSTVWTNRVKP